MSNQCRHAKSHRFTVRPMVLKQNSQSHGLFQKSHDKFKNGKKIKILIFHIFIWHFVEKRSIFIYFPLAELLCFPLYFVRNTAVLLRDDKNMFRSSRFFYLHNIRNSRISFYFSNWRNMTTATKSKFYKSKFNQRCMESYPVRGVSGDSSAL